MNGMGSKMPVMPMPKQMSTRMKQVMKKPKKKGVGKLKGMMMNNNLGGY